MVCKFKDVETGDGLGPGLLFAPTVEVDSANLAAHLIKADVVKPLKTRSVNCPNSMIRHKKVFLPPHKEAVLVREVDFDVFASVCLFFKGTECRELAPV